MHFIRFRCSHFPPVGWLTFAALAAVAKIFAQENVVELPPFLVDEPSFSTPWRTTQSPEFEILSRCSDDTTREIAQSYHRLHHVLDLVLPTRFQVKLDVPKTLILYDASLLPATAEEMLAQASQPGRSPGNAPDQPSGILRNPRFNDLDTMIVFASLPGAGAQDSSSQSRGGGSNPVRSVSLHSRTMFLTPSYVAYLMGSRVPALPSWFVTGFLSAFQKMKFADESVALSAMEWPSPRETHAPKTNAGDGPFLLSMSALLAGPEENPQYTQLWFAQSELFYRWAMDPSDVSRRPAFWKFLERAAQDRPDEAAFKACFGGDFAWIDAQLKMFWNVAVKKSATWRTGDSMAKISLSIRDATAGEIARIKGDWERLADDYVRTNSPELEQRYLGNTRRTLHHAYDHGDRDPRLLAILGLCENDAGNVADARIFLEGAVQGGVVKPRAYLELAKLRLAELQHQPAGGEGLLSAAQANEVLAPLATARRQSPPLPETYELIADVWAKCATPPSRAELASLDEGAAYFPQRSELLYRAASLYASHGFAEEASKLAVTGARNAPDDTSRARFAEFKRTALGR